MLWWEFEDDSWIINKIDGNASLYDTALCLMWWVPLLGSGYRGAISFTSRIQCYISLTQLTTSQRIINIIFLICPELCHYQCWNLLAQPGTTVWCWCHNTQPHSSLLTPHVDLGLIAQRSHSDLTQYKKCPASRYCSGARKFYLSEQTESI